MDRRTVVIVSLLALSCGGRDVVDKRPSDALQVASDAAQPLDASPKGRDDGRPPVAPGRRDAAQPAFCNGPPTAELEGQPIVVSKVEGLGYDRTGLKGGTIHFQSSTSWPEVLAVKVTAGGQSKVQPPATVDLAQLPDGWVVSVATGVGNLLTSPNMGPYDEEGIFQGSVTLDGAISTMSICLTGWKKTQPAGTPYVRLYAATVPLVPQ